MATKAQTQDLKDAGIITIDLLYRKYEVTGFIKVQHIIPQIPPRYICDNPFIIRNPTPCEKVDRVNICICRKAQNLKQYYLMNGKDMNYQMRERKRNENCNNEKNLGREMKKLKADIKREFSFDAPQFQENGPYMQFDPPKKANLSRLQDLFTPLVGTLLQYS